MSTSLEIKLSNTYIDILEYKEKSKPLDTFLTEVEHLQTKKELANLFTLNNNITIYTYIRTYNPATVDVVTYIQTQSSAIIILQLDHYEHVKDKTVLVNAIQVSLHDVIQNSYITQQCPHYIYKTVQDKNHLISLSDFPNAKDIGTKDIHMSNCLAMNIDYFSTKDKIYFIPNIIYKNYLLEQVIKQLNPNKTKIVLQNDLLLSYMLAIFIAENEKKKEKITEMSKVLQFSSNNN